MGVHTVTQRFICFEDVNMLLPVETFRDESTNTVYTTTDRMGTYCLVDMELWLNLLGIKPNNDNISQKAIDNFSALAYNGNNTESVNAANTFDVVFMVDQVNYSDEQLKVIQDSIAETSATIWKRTPEATVVIYGYNGDGRTHFKKYGRSGAENPEALNAMLNRLVHVNSIGTVVLSKALDDLITESGISKNRIYCFTFFDSVNDYTEALPSNSKDVLNDIHDGKYDINISVVSNIPEESKNNSEGKECYATALYNQTNGISIDAIDFVEKSLKHIYGENSNQFGAYNAIIATGYHTIVLDAPITIGYREAAEDVKKNPQNLERYKKSGMADTDKDGLLDFQEINFEIKAGDNELIQFDADGKMKDLPLALLCKLLYDNSEKELTYVENGWKAFEDSIYYSDLSKIHILPIISDPTSVDSDFDGVNDKDDPAKLCTVFTGSLIDTTYDIDNAEIGFKVDYNMFFNDETKFSKDLSVFASLLSQDVYENSYIRVDGMPDNGDSSLNMPLLFGLHDIKDIVIRNPEAMKSVESETNDNIDVNDGDITEFVIGHRKVIKNSETREVVAIIVRGTNGTIEEWASNFDVGADTDDYYNAVGQCNLWTNKENHKGFDVTANRVLSEIEAYMNNEFIDKSVDCSYYVTGHSRGAAIANLIAKGLIDNKKGNDKVFGYTFAAPNTTTSKEAKLSKYNSIFNIVNTDDLIPYLPLGEPCGLNSVEYNSWEFTKYGIIKTFSIKDNCESKWESISHKWDYNSNGNFNDTLFEFGNIIDTSGVFSRNYLYKFTDSDDACISFNILNYIDDQTAKNELEKMYGERMSRYCKISIVDKSPSIFDPTEHKAIIQQSPAFLMMDLVYITVKEETGGRIHGVLGCDVAPKYEKAKWEFIYSGIDSMVNIGLGGMRDPHLPISYYCISTELK